MNKDVKVDSSQSDAEEMENTFHRQAALFRELGKKMETYITAIKTTKDAMIGIHETTEAFCDPNWPKFPEFSSLLEDQAELWSLLCLDIVKLGVNYQLFADRFYQVLKTRKELSEKRDVLNTVAKQVQKAVANKNTEADHTTRIKSVLKQTQIEYRQVSDTFKCKLAELQKSQNEFILKHYKGFMEAHTLFCKESLEVHDLILQTITAFLQNPRPSYISI